MGGKQWAWSLVAAVPLMGLTVGAAQQNGSGSLPESPSAQQNASALANERLPGKWIGGKHLREQRPAAECAGCAGCVVEPGRG